MPSVAAMRAIGWGDPDSPNYRHDHIVRVTHEGVDLYVRSEAAPLFLELLRRLELRGEDLDKGQTDDWSFVNRDIRGYPGVKSKHAWGLAVDLDALLNPMGSRRHTWPADFEQIAQECGLLWGGLFSSRPDPMHFEVDTSRADTVAFAGRLVAAKLKPKPTPSWYRRVLRDLGKGKWLVGDDVQHVQTRVGMTKRQRDRVYGPTTAAAVKEWQRTHGLVADGVVGPNTARKIG